MDELQSIIVFHCCHFLRHIGICYRICVKLLKLVCAVTTHNSVKKRRLYINKRLNYSKWYCFTAAILSVIFEFVNGYVSIFYNWYPVSLRTIQWKNEVSILINGRVTAKYSVHGRYFVRHLEICNQICVKLPQLMSGVITHNSVKKRSLHINKWQSYGHL